MTVQLTGLGGFDSSSVISQLVTLATKPVTALQTKKGLVDSASSTMSTYSSKLATLKSAATALTSSSSFTSMGATSSDTSIVPSVTGSAVPSSYAIEVSQLARVQKSRSASQASATTALGQAGNLTLKVGTGDPINIAVTATDTLSDIATKISQSGARVVGSVINAGGSYRLSLQGLDTGAASAFTLTEGTGVSLGFSDPNSVVQTAQDCKLTVDGLAVTRSTNQVADAVPGVTLALTKTTTGPTTLNVAADSTSLKAKLTALVSAYNSVVNEGHADAGYGTNKAPNSVLAGDSAIRRTLDKIASTVTGLVPGTSGAYQSFATVGINLTRDGTMAFDATKFDAALTKDPAAVSKLFVTDTATASTGLMKTLSDAIDGMINATGGTVKARIEALTAQSKTLADSATKKQTQVDSYEQQLRKQFAELDQAMSKSTAMGNALSGLTSSSG